MIPKHRELALVATAAKRDDMVLDGVSIDDRVVRELAAVVGKPLAQKLEQALFFSAEVVALTRTEKDAGVGSLGSTAMGVRGGSRASVGWPQVGRKPRRARADRNRARGHGTVGDAAHPSILYLEAVAHNRTVGGAGQSRDLLRVVDVAAFGEIPWQHRFPISVLTPRLQAVSAWLLGLNGPAWTRTRDLPIMSRLL